MRPFLLRGAYLRGRAPCSMASLRMLSGLYRRNEERPSISSRISWASTWPLGRAPLPMSNSRIPTLSDSSKKTRSRLLRLSFEGLSKLSQTRVPVARRALIEASVGRRFTSAPARISLIARGSLSDASRSASSGVQPQSAVFRFAPCAIILSRNSGSFSFKASKTKTGTPSWYWLMSTPGRSFANCTRSQDQWLACRVNNLRSSDSLRLSRCQGNEERSKKISGRQMKDMPVLS